MNELVAKTIGDPVSTTGPFSFAFACHEALLDSVHSVESIRLNRVVFYCLFLQKGFLVPAHDI